MLLILWMKTFAHEDAHLHTDSAISDECLITRSLVVDQLEWNNKKTDSPWEHCVIYLHEISSGQF